MSTSDWKEAAEKWEASLPRGVTITVQQIFQVGAEHACEQLKQQIAERDATIKRLQEAYLPGNWEKLQDLKADLERERAANAKLREALECYADEKNWDYATLNRDLNDCGVIWAYKDEGAFARKALLAAKQDEGNG